MVEFKTPYTEHHLLFAQALVQLARDYGVSSFDGSIRLGWEHREHGWNHGDVRITWSEGRHGDDERIGLWCEMHASVEELAPNSAAVPPMIYYSAEHDNFYELTTKKGRGDKFHARWRHRAADFPQSREAGIDALDPSTREWFDKRYGNAPDAR